MRLERARPGTQVIKPAPGLQPSASVSYTVLEVPYATHCLNDS